MIDSKQIITRDLRQLIVEKSEALMEQNKGFADGLDEIAELLAQYDPAPSPLLNAIDLKAQDLATYYFAAYCGTKDFEKSFIVYNTVKSLVRYVLLMDRYYEVGNKKYERIARGLLQSIKKAHQGHLKYSIKYALKQFWPFWDFEQTVKKHMMRGHTFTAKELQHFNLFKSSDAPIIYARVLDNELPTFTPNVGVIIHYNQALEDILDDFEDIEEDLRDMMPNIFLLAATEYTIFSRLKNSSQARRLVATSGAIDSVLSLIEHYNKLIRDIPVPPDYAFLKNVSQDYTDRLLRMLGILK